MASNSFVSIRKNNLSGDYELKETIAHCRKSNKNLKDFNDTYYTYFKEYKGFKTKVWLQWTKDMVNDKSLTYEHFLEVFKASPLFFAKLLWEKWVNAVEGEKHG